MKNRSILKTALNKLTENVQPFVKKTTAESLAIESYKLALNSEITELDFIIREGKYYGYNILDLLDIDPDYLLWMHNEEVFKLSDDIYFLVVNEL